MARLPDGNDHRILIHVRQRYTPTPPPSLSLSDSHEEKGSESKENNKDYKGYH